MCWSPNWNGPRIAMGTPQFGILTNPYPNGFGDPRTNMGIAFLVFFSVTHKIGVCSPKIEAIPTPWHTSLQQKFRQPTHCLRKSRIWRTREGAASCPLNKRRGGFSSHHRLKVLCSRTHILISSRQQHRNNFSYPHF